MRLNAKNTILISILILSLILTGCGSVGFAKDSEFESNYANTDEEPENIYVSAADGIIRIIDSENYLIDFYELGSSEIKSLYYDGSTVITDRYGQPLSMVQLQNGDMIHVAYNSTISKAGSITLMPESFSHSDITRYSVENNGTQMSIGDDKYNIDPNSHVFSEGAEITIDQLLTHDGITIQGIDHTIYSVRVDDGHGYLELKGEDALIGGWIEIGQTLISQISDDMLFTVPEGDYTVRLTNPGIEEYRDVTIQRNQITTLDLSAIHSPEPEKGIITFDIKPETAVTEIDGKTIDTSFKIKLPVGVHELKISATGYSTVTEYFEVTGDDLTISIDLIKITEEQTTSYAVPTATPDLTSSVSGNSLTTDNNGNGYNDRRLYGNIIIDSPNAADVYEDNVYKGRIPVIYPKKAGSHVLTLRKPGYVTVSYTINVPDDGRDQKYAFPEMTVGNGSSVSGNSLATPTPTPTATPTPDPTPEPTEEP